MLLRILHARPTTVRRDGSALTEATSSTAFDAANAAWQFDTNLGFVLVKFPHPGGITVTISF